MVNNNLLCNFPGTPDLNELIREKVVQFNNLDFVVGYYGLSTLIDHESNIIDQVENRSSSFRLIIGLAHWEGLSEKSITKLEGFHQTLQSLDSSSGVWIVSENRFHGKFYLFENRTSYREAILGSSNFSSAGLSTNYEVNLHTSDQNIIHQLTTIRDRLLKTSYPMGKHELTIKGVSKKNYKFLQEANKNVPDGIQYKKPDRAPDFSIPIRADEKLQKSNLNLHFGAGRKTSDGIYIPRPYFEVEITLKRDFWTESKAADVVPNSHEKLEFFAVTDTAESFTCNFHRKTTSRKDERTLHENSAEFQSTPREALGRYLKGKLINHNCMSYGDPVTNETLECYGANQINVWVTGQKTLYLSF